MSILHTNPIFKGGPGQYGDAILDDLAKQAHEMAKQILGDWAESRLKSMEPPKEDKR